VRVALLHYAVPPVVGGVESILAQQARLLAAAGHAVTVVAARGELGAAGLRFVRVPLADSRHPRVLAAKAELDAGRVPADFAALTALLTDDLRAALAGCDVLLAHNVCSLNKNLALTAALYALNGQPGFPRLVLWHHDLAWTTPRYRAELHDGEPWDLLRRDWPGTQQVVVSAARQAELAALLGVPLMRIRVVPNGVDLAPLLKLSPQTQSLMDQMALTQAAPLLLLPVRLTPRKNIELALHTLAALRRWQPSGAPGAAPPHAAAMLLVTGPEGPHNPANAAYRQRLLLLRDELGLRGAAHFAIEHTDEYLPDEGLADFYRLADALLLPSREEGFGLPVVEAGLARLPVFCAGIPPLRAIGLDDVTYFSPEAPPEQVAELIASRLSNDPAYRLAVRARRDYAWPRIYAEQIEPLLVQAIGEPC
jgi:mannosylglucosylglycerate synthase